MSAVETLIEPFTVVDDYRVRDTNVVEHVVADALTAVPPANTEAELVAQTLAWCAALFGVESARMVRPLPAGRWAIVTWRRNGVLAYAADHAEVSMAWLVGLNRAPLVVNRPRVAQLDGGNMRPISTKTYVGLPLMCQDQLIGVIEVAGDLKIDIDSAVQRAQPRLALVAQRIVHDPLLRPAPLVMPETRCALDGGMAFGGDIVLTPDEQRFLSALRGVMSVAAASAAAGLEVRDALPIAAGLVARGLVAIEP
jgi:GAF domain-containing protein